MDAKTIKLLTRNPWCQNVARTLWENYRRIFLIHTYTHGSLNIQQVRLAVTNSNWTRTMHRDPLGFYLRMPELVEHSEISVIHHANRVRNHLTKPRTHLQQHEAEWSHLLQLGALSSSSAPSRLDPTQLHHGALFRWVQSPYMLKVKKPCIPQRNETESTTHIPFPTSKIQPHSTRTCRFIRLVHRMKENQWRLALRRSKCENDQRF